MERPMHPRLHLMRLALGLLAPAILTALTSAGPNEGGTLVLHYNSAALPSCSEPPPRCDGASLSACADAVARVDTLDPCAWGIYVLAAFPEAAEPRLAALSFGLDYDSSLLVITDYAHCGSFEIPYPGWPAPGTGTAVRLAETATGHLVTVYWLEVEWADSSPTTLALAPHPLHGAGFSDDGVPSNLDPIAGLGMLGFGMEGSVPCPPTEPAEACCLPDGSCRPMELTECEVAGGIPVSGGCDPNPCAGFLGACCLEDGSCQALDRHRCEAAGGRFQGTGTDCTPSPCASGACCLGGDCEVRTSEACRTAGGLYLGNGEPCLSSSCFFLEGCGPELGSPSTPPATAVSIGAGRGTLPSTLGDPPCGERNLHTNGSYEDGIAFSYQGQDLPYYGAFAECFSGSYEVCAAVFDFTSLGQFDANSMDVYVWEDSGGCPGSVLCFFPGIDPGTIGQWPTVTRHVVPLAGCCVSGTWWVGYWADWVGQFPHWFLAADLDGPGGCSKCCVAPVLDAPPGWQGVSTLWPEVRGIGIGADLRPCEPSPVAETSWGQLKALFR